MKKGRILVVDDNHGIRRHCPPSYFINSDDKTKVYEKNVYKMTEHGRTWYHIYFDPVRKDLMQASFMMKLQKCKDELESRAYGYKVSGFSGRNLFQLHYCFCSGREKKKPHD